MIDLVFGLTDRIQSLRQIRGITIFELSLHLQDFHCPTTSRSLMHLHQSRSLHSFQCSRCRPGGNTKASHQFVSQSNRCRSFEPGLVKQRQSQAQRCGARNLEHAFQPRQRKRAPDERLLLPGNPPPTSPGCACGACSGNMSHSRSGRSFQAKSKRFEFLSVIHELTPPIQQT